MAAYKIITFPQNYFSAKKSKMSYNFIKPYKLKSICAINLICVIYILKRNITWN